MLDSTEIELTGCISWATVSQMSLQLVAGCFDSLGWMQVLESVRQKGLGKAVTEQRSHFCSKLTSGAEPYDKATTRIRKVGNIGQIDLIQSRRF